jgi:endonuclease YncB( thermonuclease family)
MPYTVLRGHFVIRYPDLPRQGPEPDGDTVKFRPDTPGLVELLPRRSGQPPDLNARGISVRLEAIDALETHFAETHQQLAGANAARDAMLARLGFRNVVFFDDQPNRVASADADELVGYVLSNGIDANGRMIGFVYPGEPPTADGSSIFLDNAGVDGSVNASLLRDGLVYPTFYGTLPSSLRMHLAEASRAARAAGLGIWPDSTADPDSTATITGLATLETLVIWPKLFRRLVPFFASGQTSLDGLDAWLRADAVNRDDALFFLDPPEPGNMHDVIVASGQQIFLNRWPEDFIVEPDPAAPGTPTGPGTFAAGDIAIVAALPDPVGTDLGQESAILVNTTSGGIDLTGWQLGDSAGRRQSLSGSVGGGEVITIVLGGGPQLSNRGGALTLFDATGQTIDHVTYGETTRGRTVVFGR